MAKISNDRYLGFLHWVKKQLLPGVSEPANQIGITITLDFIEFMNEVQKNRTTIKEVTEDLKARRTVRRLPIQKRMIL